MIQRDAFRIHLREFDPLGIGAWAPLSEFDYMLPTIHALYGPDEDVFVAEATAYFMSCFAAGELDCSEQDVETFFRALYSHNET